MARREGGKTRGLAHSKTWRELPRFIETPLGFDAVRWDHERFRAGARTALSARTWLSALRFLENPRCLATVHWERDPVSGTADQDSDEEYQYSAKHDLHDR